ncbi:MAG: MFS transporter [Chloroflexi bacterium]|nr:MFS transporter [Chloroflexota bacterium]
MQPTPTRPKKPPIFYGWVVVAGLSVGLGFIMVLATSNFSLFVKPMADELGIGQSAFGLSFTLRLLAVAMVGPFIGRILDRYGTRVPFAVAGAVGGITVLMLAFVSNAWQMIALFTLLGMTGFWGSSSLYPTVAAAKWFVRKRAKAMSFVFAGTPIGMAISLVSTQWLISEFGWRVAWGVLGGVSAVALVLVPLLIVRNQPSDMGLEPDGDGPEAPVPSGGEAASPVAPRAAAEHPWTRAEAMRTGAFWRIATSYGLIMFTMSSFSIFRAPYFLDKGISGNLVAFGLATDAMTQLAVTLVLASLMVRFQPRFLGAFAFAIEAVALVIAMLTTEAWHMFVANILAGLGIGTLMLMQTVIWPTYFGRANIGAIRGLATPVSLVFSAAGATMTGFVFDAAGSYNIAWSVAAGGLVIGAIMLGLTPKPLPKTAQTTTVIPAA